MKILSMKGFIYRGHDFLVRAKSRDWVRQLHYFWKKSCSCR